MLELLQYEFFVNALLAAFFTGISCGLVGTYIVSRRIVFISGGITHTSFGGLGLGYYLGINPIAGAAVFSLLSALGIEFLSKKAEVREDSAIAIMWSFGMAIGIIFVYLTPGYAPNLMGYLFGSILTVSRTEIWLIASLAVIVTAFFIVFYKVILFVAFDTEFSQTRMIPAKLFGYILISLVSITIVLSIKVAGIILILSLLTIPQAAANIFVKEFKMIAILSVLIGFAGSVSGLVLSYLVNIPSGAAIIFSLVMIYILMKGMKVVFHKRNLIPN